MSDQENLQEKDIFWSSAAILQVQTLLKNTENTALRFGIRGGGCNGYMYFVEFEDMENIDEEDDFMELNVPEKKSLVVIDRKSLAILEEGGTVIDYKKDLLSQNFTFENRVAKRTCSCGESFTIDR